MDDSATVPTTTAGGTDAVTALERQLVESQVIEAIRTVFDPEIPVNIYDMGMIYNIDIVPPASVHVRMTLTSPMCPVAGTLPGEVEQKIKNLRSVAEAKVELVWDPPWTPAKMSEAAKLELGME